MNKANFNTANARNGLTAEQKKIAQQMNNSYTRKSSRNKVYNTLRGIGYNVHLKRMEEFEAAQNEFNHLDTVLKDLQQKKASSWFSGSQYNDSIAAFTENAKKSAEKLEIALSRIDPSKVANPMAFKQRIMDNIEEVQARLRLSAKNVQGRAYDAVFGTIGNLKNTVSGWFVDNSAQQNLRAREALEKVYKEGKYTNNARARLNSFTGSNLLKNRSRLSARMVNTLKKKRNLANRRLGVGLKLSIGDWISYKSNNADEPPIVGGWTVGKLTKIVSDKLFVVENITTHRESEVSRDDINLNAGMHASIIKGVIGLGKVLTLPLPIITALTAEHEKIQEEAPLNLEIVEPN